MTSWCRATPVACILLGALSVPCTGQVVRGRVTDRSGGGVVEGGVVTLLDTAGVAVAQVLSQASGWYALTAPGAGRYRLRVERIGYQDVVTRPFALAAGQVLDRDLTAAVQAIALEGLTVKGKGRCALRREQGVETQALWRAVRTALTATELTKRERRLHYDVGEYTRDLNPQTLEQEGARTSRVRSGLAEHPFVSAPVDVLTREGFVERGAEQTAYYAPDAEVLLSEAFLEGHCLQVVVPSRSDTLEAGRVGLAFRPVGRRDVSDVRGTLWVDAATDQLRTLEYRYTGLDVPDARELGGRVEFARLPNGLWIVSRWWVRMPVMPAEHPRHRMTDPTPGQMRPHLARILEQGGVVIAARDATGARVYASTDPMASDVLAAASKPRSPSRPGGAERTPSGTDEHGVDVPPARAGSVRGRVVDAATGDPLANIEVMLTVGADSTGPSTGVMSGPDGTFSFKKVAPGTHLLRTVSMGYIDGAWHVRVGANGLSARLELHGRPIEMEGLDVVASARTRAGGFYLRKAEKNGYFVDRAEIERVAPKRPSDLMRMVPGVRIICPGFSIKCTLRTEATPALVGPDAGDCPIQYYLDGVLMDETTQRADRFSLDDLPTDEIQAIEVYPHAAMVPPRFNSGVNSRCGVIVIWTRGR